MDAQMYNDRRQIIQEIRNKENEITHCVSRKNRYNDSRNQVKGNLNNNKKRYESLKRINSDYDKRHDNYRQSVHNKHWRTVNSIEDGIEQQVWFSFSAREMDGFYALAIHSIQTELRILSDRVENYANSIKDLNNKINLEERQIADLKRDIFNLEIKLSMMR